MPHLSRRRLLALGALAASAQTPRRSASVWPAGAWARRRAPAAPHSAWSTRRGCSNANSPRTASRSSALKPALSPPRSPTRRPETVTTRKLRLGAFVMATGHHVAAWRHPGSQPDSGVNIDHCIDVARTAERGLFDQLFVADSPGLWHRGATSRSADRGGCRTSSRSRCGPRCPRSPGTSASSPPPPRRTRSRICWRASSPLWTTSARAVRRGTWSPPAPRTCTATSAWTPIRTRRCATNARTSSSRS